MSFFKSKNPALRSGTFTQAAVRNLSAEPSMTIEGTVNKIGFLTLLVFAGALFTWQMFHSATDPSVVQPYLIGGGITGLVLALIIIFKKTTAPYLAPLYCLAEGVALGGLSAFMNYIYPGIVLQAILLTMGILFSLLVVYRMGIIKVTERFKLIVVSATAGIALFYFISFIGGFFGFQIPLIHSSSTFGIIFSLVVVGIASLNLVLDFEFITEGAESNAPKYMEWYAAFGLMVTLIWLYIEILRLISKLRER
ncbi:Bax inhibitor-1/YccA family protein [Roseivirga sp. BDSF3-8]|uniref:Bax inhibitor-1/YccA family protein n=1 Tax=Roseivirga sp. BDSF3-8 TaxID=3241598 RepID=UPI003531E642